MGEDKYVVRYFYIRKRGSQYFIFKKMYNSVLTEKQYQQLKGKRAFLCKTKPTAQAKLSAIPAVIAMMGPANATDLKSYKELNLVKAIDLKDEQKKALAYFQKNILHLA